MADRRSIGVAAASLHASYELYFGPRAPKPTKTEIQLAKVNRALAKLKAAERR